jgi:hypothetical protein
MIPQPPPPSVCLIDDDEKDYGPILEALARLGISYIHLTGSSKELRPGTLRGVRVIFTDLHLANNIGKDAASYTANVFKTLLPADTAPTVVVIWSKYADDTIAYNDLPPEDQPTEAELFKATLIEAVPAFKDRLVFCEMKKPKVRDRPKGKEWVKRLKKDITKEIQSVAGFDLLWAWESFVREAGLQLSEHLTALALQIEAGTTPANQPAPTLHDKLQLALRLLVKEQGGPDCTAKTAPLHLATVLAQTLADQLEHSDGLKALGKHGAWLADQTGLPKSSAVAPGLNSLLLTSGPSRKGFPFIPGTIYRFKREDEFNELFGITPTDFLNQCYNGPPARFQEWQNTIKCKPVLIEISPACDVHQGTRRNALLLGGLVLTPSAAKQIKRSEALEILPTISLRWPADTFSKENVMLAFSSRLKVTISARKEPSFLTPWFRVRELPAASLRNWHANHASRVGYVSLRAS